MIDTSALNKPELKELLIKVKLLNSLTKSLWKKKWLPEYNIIGNNNDSYRVEYCDYQDKNLPYIEEESIKWFNKLFWLNLSKTDIKFIKNKNLVWWIRLFLNDNMFDFSYQRFEKILK